MKKYILAAALVLASTSAMADRVVSGATGGIWGGLNSKAAACDKAKQVAASKREGDEQVESYTRCDCEQNKEELWSCTVDARLEKKS